MRNRLILVTSLAFAAFSSFTGCYWRHRHHDTVIVEEHRRHW
jgi:hypothetical protein